MHDGTRGEDERLEGAARLVSRNERMPGLAVCVKHSRAAVLEPKESEKRREGKEKTTARMGSRSREGGGREEGGEEQK